MKWLSFHARPSSDLFETCSLEECFGEEPVLIVNTTLTERKTTIDEAVSKTVENYEDKKPEKGETYEKQNESESNVTDKDLTNRSEDLKVEQHRSLYLAFSHLINLANNLGCVQRSTSVPENKVPYLVKIHIVLPVIS